MLFFFLLSKQLYILSQPADINSPRFCTLNMTFRNHWRGESQLYKFFFLVFLKNVNQGWIFSLPQPLTNHMKNPSPPTSMPLAQGGQVGGTWGIIK